MTASRSNDPSPSRRRRLTTVGLITGAAALLTMAFPANANATYWASVFVDHDSSTSAWSTWGKAWDLCQEWTYNNTKSIRIDEERSYDTRTYWNCYDTTDGT
ncbi:hypothetical protein GTY44_20695 [Streptomyces sp. SID5914]|nr:hypothetical protein [Streptomyces sp. SID5914]MZG15875.1 hypothetical protein [Streptomyces sp. SID5914]